MNELMNSMTLMDGIFIVCYPFAMYLLNQTMIKIIASLV